MLKSQSSLTFHTNEKLHQICSDMLLNMLRVMDNEECIE